MPATRQSATEPGKTFIRHPNTQVVRPRGLVAQLQSHRAGCTAFGHCSTNINRYGIAIAETCRNYITRCHSMACRKHQTCKIKTMEWKPTNAIGRSISHSALPDCAGDELPRIEPLGCKCKSHGCISGSLWRRMPLPKAMFFFSNDSLLGANKLKMSVDHPPAHASAGNAGIYHAFHPRRATTEIGRD